MMNQATITMLLFGVFGLTPSLGSKKFLAGDPTHSHSSLSGRMFHKDIMSATGFMLGCGGQVSQEHLASIERALLPMWKTLPKNSGRIDRRSLRYLVHRHFMQSSSLTIRGFEPTRPVNDSHWGVADILSQEVPAFVESVLESSQARQHGFVLHDAVHMVVMLERLIFDSEATLLERIYSHQGKRKQDTLSHEPLLEVLKDYILSWVGGVDIQDIEQLKADQNKLEDAIPQLDALMHFVEGQITAFQYTRERKPQVHHGKNTLLNQYSFDDAHEIVAAITRSFQSFWESECVAMKSSLVALDTHNTGRVPLAQFYATTIDGEWRFGESESYLRELGALDETSPRLEGPQVIISNYIQATSNCIVSTEHYHVCCVSECEALLGEIETAIGAPTALPSDIFPIVGNMTAQATVDDDEPPLLDESLVGQLEEVAKHHGGMVPLHGRLFAQWLHYVYPRECPFPHKMGMVSSVTPDQYGQEFVATDEAMRKYARNASASVISEFISKDELQWMSQWSSDEELMVDYSSEFGASKEIKMVMGVAGLLLIAGGIYAGVVSLSGKGVSEPKWSV